ncbi:MAG: hypothetical protein Q7J25_07185 [Vicinamibacterales bacterium]|nr:hypothetical protein [Vicinamibacterales bacterium]
MTSEEIQARIRQLRIEREQAIGTVNAYNGAIQDCEWWLQQIEGEATASN